MTIFINIILHDILLMKKSYIYLILLFVLASSVFADGMIVIHDQDMWRKVSENEQLCAINYEDGTQNMILAVSTKDKLSGEKAVWLFPVPSDPARVEIDVIKGFPQFWGKDIVNKVDEVIDTTFMLSRSTQIYTTPIFMFGVLNPGAFLKRDGLEVYDSVTKMGLTTEVVSAKNSDAMISYLQEKNLDLPPDARKIIDDYIGNDYSFVISWISDVDEFLMEQGNVHDDYRGAQLGNIISVNVKFPTDRIFFPLKPTSIYGNEGIPILIYVMDYVQPDIFDDIKDSHITVDYFYDNVHYVKDEHTSFFGEDSIQYKKERKVVKNFRYTKVKIEAEPNKFTQDLWFNDGLPARFYPHYILNRHTLEVGIIIFLIISCLSSLLAGMIFLKNTELTRLKMGLLGLANFFTLIGFSTATYFVNARHISKDVKEYIQQQKLNLFELNLKKYYKIIGIFGGIIIIWFIIGRSELEILLFLMFLPLILWMLYLAFKLSKEKLTDEHLQYLEKRSITVKIIDLKKLIFIVIFNISLVYALIKFVDYDILEIIAFKLGFYYMHYDYPFARTESVLVLAFLLLFTLSITIIALYEKYLKQKIGFHWFSVTISDKSATKKHFDDFNLSELVTTKKKYFLTFAIIFILIITWLILGRFIEFEWFRLPPFVGFFWFLGILVLSIYLAKENNGQENDYNIYNKKVLFILLSLNFIGSILSIIFLPELGISESIAKSIGFTETFSSGKLFAVEENLIPLSAFLVLLSSVLISLLLRFKLSWMKPKDFFVTEKGKNKIGFIIAFSLIFLIINYLIEFIMKLIL
jgi:hypothetical protein